MLVNFLTAYLTVGAFLTAYFVLHTIAAAANEMLEIDFQKQSLFWIVSGFLEILFLWLPKILTGHLSAKVNWDDTGIEWSFNCKSYFRQK